MKGQKEAGVLRQQLEKLKKLQEIQRQKMEMERKKREGIPLNPAEQVTNRNANRNATIIILSIRNVDSKPLAKLPRTPIL